MTSSDEIKGRAKLIVDTCNLIRDHVREMILTTPQEVCTIMYSIKHDAYKIIELIEKEKKDEQ